MKMSIGNLAFLWQRPISVFASIVFVLFALMPPALALEAVDVISDQPAIDLSKSYELYESEGAGIQVQTAPDADGVVNRIEVRSATNRANSRWLAFALANNSDKQLDRLIIAPHYRLVRSGLIWPKLGSQQIISITPSQGFSLEKLDDREADIFQITLDPGTVVTFVAELTSNDVPRLTLWEPNAYKDTVNSYTLYEGIVLGIAGLLAVFLTILFVVKGSAMFPATAALAWAVLAYICVEFGFIVKIISLTPSDLNFWRAGVEVFLAASVVVFLYAYLHLNRWNTRYSYLVIMWLVGLGALMGVAVIAPAAAAGTARISFAVAAILGLLLILLLSFRGFDRAILLIPTWCLILAWVFGGWLTIKGQLDNDIIQPALGGGLVLIIMLISFTVMQHAFSGGGIAPSLISDVERSALALTGAGDAVWDWNVDRDEIFAGKEAASNLGLKPTALNGSPQIWLELMHPEDRDRFKSTLDIILDHRRGRVSQDFRLRATNGQYHWLNIRARPVIGSDGEVVHCVGTVNDVSELRLSQERMMHDAVHDNMTGLPNRQLFMDRLETAISLAGADKNLRPTVFVIDFDRFAEINDAFGLSTGDSILLTMARRLDRILQPQDCLARLFGDQFALLLLSQSEPEQIAEFADTLQRTIKTPMKFSEQEIYITASIGLVSWAGKLMEAGEMIKDAEIAMFQGKRVGGDRIEPFRPSFRAKQSSAIHLESELRQALEMDQLELFYQPIIDLDTKMVAGFEALMRWRHPLRGLISPSEFIPLAEKTGLITQIGRFALQQAATQLAEWQNALGQNHIFVSVNVSTRQLLLHDLIEDIKALLKQHKIAPSTLKLELTESLVMENPEQSAHVLTSLKQLGAGLSLDDFGTGYSSLSHLMRFPFDTIKIDRAFVVSEGSKGRPIILRSIVNMAHDLGMTVVAEGAESETDALELHQLGCEFAQGFLFGEPMTADVALLALRQDYPNK